MQCQVKFNRVPKKVPEKVWEALVHSRSGATGFRRRFRGRFGRLWCRAKPDSRRFRRKFRAGKLWCRTRSSSTGFRKRFAGLWCGVPAFGFAARFTKMCQKKMLQLLRIPQHIILVSDRVCVAVASEPVDFSDFCLALWSM